MTTFDQRERSLAEGAPLRLYQFARGSMAWRYNSSARDVTHQTFTFSSVAGGITDDGIRQTGETTPDELTLTAPAGLDVAQLYRVAPPSETVQLTVFSRHDGADDWLVSWTGDVRAVKWPALDRCQIICAPMSARMEMTGLRLTWDRACPHALYSAACGVSAALWRVAALLSSLDGATLTVPEAANYPDGYFTAGIVEWATAGGVLERRGIEQHASVSLTLIGGTAGIPPGTALSLYPGCRQTTAGCRQFGNLLNFGGIPHLAGTSPFNGNNPF
ncbi:hypothetical protein FACS1894101_1570 [Betaproteobacteria bacterium]|nr:hypothetical protein FACS1894101_1570 [Betaproteobacteria bacterium]